MRRLSKTKSRRHQIHGRLQDWKAYAIVLLFAASGGYFVLASHAATAPIAKEPELGTTSSGAQVITDSTASSGKSIKFPTGSNLTPNSKFVSPTGSDSSDGSQNAPWKTLGKALPALAPGQTLYMRGGTYGGFNCDCLQKGTATSMIRVTAYPAETPTVLGLVRLYNLHYWKIDGIGFTWQDGIAGNEHMVRFTNGVGWVFENNHVYGAKSFANIHITNWNSTTEPKNAVIRGNRIHDVIQNGYQPQNFHNIYAGGGQYSSYVIERNLLYNSPGDQIKLGAADPDGSASGATVRYNTMYNGRSNISFVGHTSNFQVYRNIIHEAWMAAIILYGVTDDGTTIIRDNFWGGSTTFIAEQSTAAGTASKMTSQDGNLKGDPQFVNPSAGDFRPLNAAAQNYGHLAP